MGQIKMPVSGANDAPIIIKGANAEPDGAELNEGLNPDGSTNLNDVEETDATEVKEQHEQHEEVAPIATDGLDTIEIDGEVHYLTEDGDTVNVEGLPSFTRDELNSFRMNSDTIDMELLNSNSELNLTDDEGNPMVFENTVEGLIKRETVLRDKVYKQGIQDGVNQLFDNDPVLKAAVDHYSKTGEFNTFTPAVDYSKVTLAEADEGTLEEMIRKAETKRGNKPDKIERLIEFYKADNRLLEEATDSKEYMIAKQTEEKQLEQQANDAKAIQAQEELVKFLGFNIDSNGKEVIINNEGSVYNKIVDKGQIGNITIPQSGILITKQNGEKQVIKRRDVFNYIALAADDKGHSQAELDEMRAMSNIDTRLTRFLYNLTKGDMSSLVTQGAETKKVQKIRKLNSTNARPTTTSSKSNNKNSIELKLPVN